jgi:hypothetical protein
MRGPIKEDREQRDLPVNDLPHVAPVNRTAPLRYESIKPRRKRPF